MSKVSCKILRLSDVEGLAKTYLNAWKSGKVYCFHENCFPKRLLFNSDEPSLSNSTFSRSCKW